MKNRISFKTFLLEKKLLYKQNGKKIEAKGFAIVSYAERIVRKSSWNPRGHNCEAIQGDI